MKHTPGPWATVYDSVVQTWDIHPAEINLCGSFARVWKAPHQSISEQEANARLIAAAPIMLEALQKIAAWEFDIMGDCVKDATNVAKAAIREAT